MIKQFLIAVLVSFVAGCAGGCSTPSAAIRPESRVGDWQYSVSLRVYIKCPGEDDYTGTASAVAVRPGYLITAYHVVDGNCPGATYEVVTYEGQRFMASVSRSAPEVDTALMFLDTGEFAHWVSPSPIALRLDDEVCSIGGDWSVLFMKKCGRVNKITGENIYSNLWTKRGNSGGPVFKDRQLVGIISAAMMNPTSEWQSLAMAATHWSHLLEGI